MNPIARAFELAVGLPADFCTTCRGPNPNAPFVIDLEEGQELSTCEACGRTTDPHGNCLERARADDYIEIIEIELEPPEDP